MRDAKNNKRLLLADPVYNSRLVTRLINRVMKDGKKSIAIKQVYEAFKYIGEQTKQPAEEVFRVALENIKPVMEVRSRRVGGAAYQVPTPVRGDRRESLAIRWLVTCSRLRPNKEFHHFYLKLATEIIAASKNEGETLKKKDNMHKMAEANKAFAHFRW